MNFFKNKLYVHMAFSMLIIVFLIFPTSVFYGDYNKIFENYNVDNSLKVVVYKAEVYNFFSFYKFLRGENYFFVVYNKCGKAVFKPYLWFGMDRSVAYGGFHFSNYDKETLFFPTNYGVDSIKLNSDKYDCP